MYTSTVVEVLISSPSDVPDACDAIHEEISQWNIANSRRRGVSAVGVRWETHAVPQMGEHPQGILNRQLVDRCDLLVAVFGTRLGTPTPNALSGTAEEIQRFIASGKPVMLYRLTGRERPDTDREQLQMLEAFLKSQRDGGLFSECDSVDKLRTEFRRHISTQLADFEPDKRLPPAKLSELELNLLEHLGVNGRMYLFQLTEHVKLGGQRILFHFDRLADAGLVHRTHDRNEGPRSV